MEKKANEKIQAKLHKKLGPEFLSYRQGFGNIKLSYVEGWLIINLANEIFGYNGWSSKIVKIKTEYFDHDEKKQTYSVGISVIARITLTDGTCKEDVGFGSAENIRRKGDAFEKSKKEAATDALKRALRQFGNALGNCCYNKEYLKDMIHLKQSDKNNLSEKDYHRKKENRSKAEDSFDFDNLDSSAFKD